MNDALQQRSYTRLRGDETYAAPWDVFVADDCEEDRAEVRRLLMTGSERQFRFTELVSGADVVRICTREGKAPPDCLILDYHFPDLNAEEILDAIRGDFDLPPCPVVVLTGGVGDGQAKGVLRAGAQDFIGKDWLGAESLSRAIENAVERHAMALELRDRGLALAESRQQLTLALRAANMTIFTWDIPKNEVRRHLRSAESLSVVDAEQIGPDRFEEVAALVIPEDRARFDAEVEKALRGEGEYYNQYRVDEPSGPVTWLEERGRVIFDPAGNPLRLIGVSADVTARKQGEADLKRREHELRSLADNTPDILTRFDRKLRHVFVNEAIRKATGRSPAEFLGRTNRDLGMADHLCDFWEEATRLVFDSHEPRTIEFEHESPEGLRHYHARLVPEFGSGGEVEHVLGITHDRTIEACAQRALLEADRRKDEFLAMLAHELRNPLAAISNASRLLKECSGDAETLEFSKNVIAHQVKQLARLVDDLLDVSRITNGKVELKKEPLDVAIVLPSAVDVVRPLFEKKHHRLQVCSEGPSLMILGDRTRLEQVVINLLTNAAKYTDQGGLIRLSAALEGNEVVVRVRDDGVGIPEDQLSVVFDLFSQVNTTIDRSQGGLGIGLTLVKRLVELHDGRVSASSQGRGRGSEFTIRLPHSGPEMGRGDASTGLTGRDRSSKAGMRVLVVDDSLDTARTMSRLLKLQGYATGVVHDGASALEIADDFRPEAVLLDIGLPEMDGYQVAREFRKRGPQDLLLIALTGYGQQEDVQQALDAGFDRHMTKPVDFDLLDRILEEFRDRHRSAIGSEPS